jgi:hypothetical protein
MKPERGAANQILRGSLFSLNIPPKLLAEKNKETTVY